MNLCGSWILAALLGCLPVLALSAELRCQPSAPSTPWALWFRTVAPKPKGVVLVAHGLNLLPAKMDSLARALQDQGFDVLRLALSGHRGVPDEIKNVTRELWIAEFFQAYCEAEGEARRRGAPLSFVGYSLGGLLGLDFLNSHPESGARFERMVLFAPAAAVKARSKLIKILAIFGRGFMVPSWADEAYRANQNGTSMAAYSALFDSLDALSKSGIRQTATPTLVHIDPEDELVSRDGLRDLIDLGGLGGWKLREVSKSGSPGSGSYHHLIIDEPSLGPAEWSRIRRETVDHLAGVP